MNVADVAGLARIRHWVRRLAHDDETLLDRVVTLYRSTGLVGRIVCSTVDLASQAGTHLLWHSLQASKRRSVDRLRACARRTDGARRLDAQSGHTAALAAVAHQSTFTRPLSRPRAAKGIVSTGFASRAPQLPTRSAESTRMSSISNPSAPGAPVQVVAESPVRAPLAGFIPWTTPGAPAVGSIPLGFDAQVVSVPNAFVDRVGGSLNRQ
jgi:hypothetical protein